MKYFITISLPLSGLACLLFAALTKNALIGISISVLLINVLNAIGIVKMLLELEDIKNFQNKYQKKSETRFDEVYYQVQRIKDILLDKESLRK